MSQPGEQKPIDGDKAAAPNDSAEPSFTSPRPLTKLSAEDLATLNEEIAGMARAGLPLDQGLAMLAREMGKGRLQRVTSDLADDLRSGLTLPEAIERQGSRVPPYYAALVLAGTRTGRFPLPTWGPPRIC